MSAREVAGFCLARRDQVLVQSSLAGVLDACASITACWRSAGAVSAGAGVEVEGAADPAFATGGLDASAWERRERRAGALVLPGVGALSVATTGEAGNVVLSALKAAPSEAPYAGPCDVAGRVEAGHVGRAAGDGVELWVP